MPSDTSVPTSGSVKGTKEQGSNTGINDGIVGTIGNERLKADIAKVTVPTHDKLKAYLDTKPKDDPWSPYTVQDAGACASSMKDK